MFLSCNKNDGNYTIKDIRTYKNTPAWELAKAVENQNTKNISEIASKNKELLNYQEPKLGFTLLMWAVKKEKFESVKSLLINGADINIRSKSGSTALFFASSYSWVDTEAKKDSKYVELLLKYGADPNIANNGTMATNIDKGTTPLMEAVSVSLEKVKALVEAGADINAKTETGKTAVSYALGGIGDGVKSAYYLIVKKGARIDEPYYFRSYGINNSIEYHKPHYPIQALRNWIFKLDSEEYRMKMEIVKEANRQGQNYWDVPVPKTRLEQIKHNYPDTWQEYLEKY